MKYLGVDDHVEAAGHGGRRRERPGARRRGLLDADGGRAVVGVARLLPDDLGVIQVPPQPVHLPGNDIVKLLGKQIDTTRTIKAKKR